MDHRQMEIRVNPKRKSTPIGNIPPAEAEQRYYAMLDGKRCPVRTLTVEFYAMLRNLEQDMIAKAERVS